MFTWGLIVFTGLWLILAAAHGYPLQRWLTYRQALALGGQVRQGEHGATVVVWHLQQREAGTEPEPVVAEPKARVIPLLRAYTVFNVARWSWSMESTRQASMA